MLLGCVERVLMIVMYPVWECPGRSYLRVLMEASLHSNNYTMSSSSSRVSTIHYKSFGIHYLAFEWDPDKKEEN